MSKQSRRFAWTWNNYPQSFGVDFPSAVEEATEGFVECGIVGWETGKEGTPHLQGFFLTKVKVTFSGFKGKLVECFGEEGKEIHYEFAQGNAKQNFDYCSKEGKWKKWGDWATCLRDGFAETNKAAKRERGEGHDYGAALRLAKDGDIQQIAPELLIKHYRSFKEIASDARSKPEDLVGGRNFIIYGRSGHGKSYAARHVYNEGQPVYTKDWTKWWPAYEGQQCIVLDDLAPEHAKGISDLLKIWGDAYPFNAEVKGGSTGWIRPWRFIITTQYKLEELFRDKRTFDAISRRFQFVELTYKWDDPRAAGGPGFVLPPVPGAPAPNTHGTDVAVDGVVQPGVGLDTLPSLDIGELIDLAKDCSPFGITDEFEGYW